MTLDEAIAEVKRVTQETGPWAGDEFYCAQPEYDPERIDHAIAAILNAVASGELVKRALADHGPTERIDAAKS